MLDGANLGAAAPVRRPSVRLSVRHVRLFWTNMLLATILQAALPTLLLPSPSLDSILLSYNVPTKPGHIDRLPFALHHQLGWERVCMPTVVSYLRNNMFRAKASGAPEEGQVFNLHTDLWEELDKMEKEMLLGFQLGETAVPGVTSNQRAIRIGRALDATTMRWSGAFLHATQV